jgi:hypothetical protein
LVALGKGVDERAANFSVVVLLGLLLSCREEDAIKLMLDLGAER